MQAWKPYGLSTIQASRRATTGMTQQLTLEDATGSRPIRNDLEAAYRVWLAEHQQVFALFEKFALEMLGRRRRFGIGMLTERVRWEVRNSWAPDHSGYKINNNHRSFIARDLIHKYPAMADFIETRKVHGEEEEPR